MQKHILFRLNPLPYFQRFLVRSVVGLAAAVLLLPAGFTAQAQAPAAEKESKKKAATKSTGPRFENEIKAFEASDQTNLPPRNGIVFIGSSSIKRWKTLVQDFPGLPVINRGFGGSEIADSVRYADRIVIPYHPRMVVLYAGGNDINAGKPVEQVFSDFKAFVEKVRHGLPEVKVAYISVAGNPSRWAQVEKVKALNKLAEDYIKSQSNMVFINVFPAMLGDNGEPIPDIFVEDRLHMNEKGYKIWTGIVGKYLKP